MSGDPAGEASLWASIVADGGDEEACEVAAGEEVDEAVDDPGGAEEEESSLDLAEGFEWEAFGLAVGGEAVGEGLEEGGVELAAEEGEDAECGERHGRELCEPDGKLGLLGLGPIDGHG